MNHPLGMIRSASHRPGDRAVRACLLIASATAAGIHLGAAGEHLREWVPSGAFMLVTGVFQLGWAVAVARGARRDAAVAGAVINAAVIGVWVLSRTTGLPAGPEPWMPEHIHAGDAIATAMEAVIVAVVLVPSARTTVARGAFLRLACAGAILSMFATSHGRAHERLAAAATLVVTFCLTGFAAQGPRVRHAIRSLGRDHEHASYARLDPRHLAPARAGVGAGGL